jgi:hypothetical protein
MRAGGSKGGVGGEAMRQDGDEGGEARTRMSADLERLGASRSMRG